MRVEIHFVFISLHFTGNKKKNGGPKISPGAIFRATRDILKVSTVTVNRLSIPTSLGAGIPDVRSFSINISYPMMYAYLTANSQKLIISENAVIREPREDFKFAVNLSLQTQTVNLIRPLLYLLFTANRKREA
jgi:hypothetical protein